MTAAADVTVPTPRSSIDAAYLITMRDALRAFEDPRWRADAIAEAWAKLEDAWRWILLEMALHLDGGEQYPVTAAVEVLEERSRRLERDGAGHLPHHNSTTRIMLNPDRPTWYTPVNPYALDLVFRAADRFCAALTEVETRYAQSLADNAGEIQRLRAVITRLENAPAPPQ